MLCECCHEGVSACAHLLYPFIRLGQSHAALAQVAACDISPSNNNDTRPHAYRRKRKFVLLVRGSRVHAALLTSQPEHVIGERETLSHR